MGSGPQLVKAANWLTHLQYDLESPVWQHWIRFFSQHFRFVRYDERGCGMTQWQVPDVSMPLWAEDLREVIDVAVPEGKLSLLGISQGAAACIAYAVKHPERVSHLILYGGYPTGWAYRGDEEGWRKYQAIVELARLGWGSDNAAFRQIFTSRFDSNGIFVVDGVVGDYLCQKYGDIQATPLTIEVKSNRIHSLVCANQELLEEFRAYTSTDDNSNRVGEFAVGTNTACKDIIGNILQDEKIPGIHIAFGHPYAEHTGQTWLSRTHIDCVGRDFDIWFDDEQVMERGKFLV